MKRKNLKERKGPGLEVDQGRDLGIRKAATNLKTLVKIIPAQVQNLTMNNIKIVNILFVENYVHK